MANAVVIVDGAILSAEAEGALARVMVAQVDTGGAVLARIEIFGAELNLLIAVSACWGHKQDEAFQIKWKIIIVNFQNFYCHTLTDRIFGEKNGEKSRIFQQTIQRCP